MIKIYIKISLVGLLCLFISSCTKYQKLRKTIDWQPKYEAAMKYYEKKDFTRAIGLFEDILPIIRGTKIQLMFRPFLASPLPLGEEMLN